MAQDVRFDANSEISPNGGVATGASGPMVLVVDDSAAGRHELRQVLGAARFDVLEAHDGEQALSVIAAHPELALVLCDVNMPILNGLEFPAQVKSNPATAALQIMMLTTECQPASIRQAKRAGACGWIIEPYKPEMLLAAVNKLTAS